VNIWGSMTTARWLSWEKKSIGSPGGDWRLERSGESGVGAKPRPLRWVSQAVRMLVWSCRVPAFVAREVMFDDVHILVRVRLTDSPAELSRKFKGRASRVWRAEFAWLGRRRVLWSKSYFAVSVGYVSESAVRRYIEHQWDAAA